MHDIINFVLSGKDKTHKYEVYRGCTEIFDNVFIGANSKILYNVKIGPNAIIAAGSVVSKDVPEGSVVGGVPAKVIGRFDDIQKVRLDFSLKYRDIEYDNQIALLWSEFDKKHI